MGDADRNKRRRCCDCRPTLTIWCVQSDGKTSRRQPQSNYSVLLPQNSQGQQRRKIEKHTFPSPQSKINGRSSYCTDMRVSPPPLPPTERKQEETSASFRQHGKCRLDKTEGRLCSPTACVHLPAGRQTEMCCMFHRLPMLLSFLSKIVWLKMKTSTQSIKQSW